jgi:hypothetical protein
LRARQTLAIVLKLIRVECFVLQIHPPDPMPRICSRARDCISDVSAGEPEFCGEIPSRDSIFIYGFRSDCQRWPAQQIIVGFNAIEKEVRRGRPLAIEHRAAVGAQTGLHHEHDVGITPEER